MEAVRYRNERAYPYHVEIPVAVAGLDIPLNRQIIKFHESRHLQLRHGRTILRGGENYYRWCFPDLMTALAFVEQFSGVFDQRQQNGDLAKMPLTGNAAL
jgi:hypothetical protein